MSTMFDNILGHMVVKPTDRTPFSVLSELAASLYKQVGYKMEFDVATSANGDRVAHTLRVAVKQIDYVLELVTLSHKVLQLYPVRMYGYVASAQSELANEQDLVNALVTVFQSDATKEIIGTLLVQAA